MSRQNHRLIVGTLLESMVVCDATRSHESDPRQRARARAIERRALRICAAVLVFLFLLIGVVVRATVPPTPPAVAGSTPR